MPRITEEPVITKKPRPGGMDEEAISHPAFALIGASRVSGHTNLFASDFSHNAFMTISIRRAELRRSLSNDWHYGREELIEVAMSEAQWATFVSSSNVGSGVPCTLQHLPGALVPGLPNPPPRTKQFAAEAKDRLEDSVKQLDDLLGYIDLLGLSKAKAEGLKAHVRSARGNLTGGLPFIATQFDEHMEVTVERAKAEIHGYMTGTLMRSGLQAISGGVLPLQLDHEGSDQ